MTAAGRTAVSRPKPESLSSRRSRTSSKPGSGQDEAVDAPERAQPVAGLRERDAHVPASALLRAAGERRHRGKRHQEAGAVIERLRRQRLRRVGAGGLRLGDIEAVGILHQRIEAAPRRPTARRGHRRRARHRRCRGGCAPPPAGRSRGRQWRRAGSPARRCRRRASRPASARAAVGVAQIDGGRELAAAVVDDQRLHRRQVPRRHQQHVGAVRRERAAAHRPRDHAREIEHPDAGERAVAGRQGLAAAHRRSARW